MAIIKCPECGNQVSNKAAACPQCGVKISGNITRCENCGELYLKEDGKCKNCNKDYSGNEYAHAQEASAANVQEKAPATRDNKKGNNRNALIISFIIATIICGTCLYMYYNAKNGKEKEEYEYAMKSSDPMVLQNYLDTFKDAPAEHRDSIAAHLQLIKDSDREWINVVMSGSRNMLDEYISKHPDSPHRQEALHKIDSLDWVLCRDANTEQAYKEYIDKHSDGDYYEDAQEALRSVKEKEITAEERTMINNTFYQFFFFINNRDEAGLTSTVADNLTLLNKVNATKSDVAEFMNKQYKDGVRTITWRRDNNFDINKREIGDKSYEYTVTFTAVKTTEMNDAGKSTDKYKINAKVNPEGYISEFKMTKSVEE